MLIVLQKVLEAEDVARVRGELEKAEWREGAATAGAAARPVKHNLQALNVAPLTEFVREALVRHSVFRGAAHMKRMSGPMFSKYEPGMTYGPHVDNAVMGAGEGRVRTDIAFTIFLSEPDSYDGGALTIESVAGPQAIRLKAGDAVLYPANSIHHVSEVTRGVRLAAVGWAQSQIRDPAQREILFDLSIARARFADAGGSRDNLLLMDKVTANLLRMWADF